ncbi:transmembrane protein 252 [Patagioenas fasciata monilis]|uniref:Transmembrane protein 252 n=1 Tax=Patagioenas fasciata monilis TaxID=372326 RepID=A0A1V4L143_PATFA|nr:transmembrane protein 252 [Patagioenas fasciata monilis]
MSLRCPIERACEELSPPELKRKSTVGRTGAFLIPSNMTPPFRICINGVQYLDPSSILESFIALTTEALLLPQTVVATLGLFLLVAGIFWSTFHEVSKCGGLSSIVIQNPSHRALRISTVDRPDFYPPSYEDSTDPEKQSSVPLVDFTIKQEEIINIPPPPYSKSSTELVSGTDEQEQPPPYELSVQWLQHQQTADQCSNLGRTESNFNPSTQENSYQQDTDCQGISERATPVRTSETSNA